MMATMRPLIAICGTTGVGKSKLAIELALALSHPSSSHPWRGARIINADAMQVYAGMDVITNKVPESEMQGIEHSLMSFKKPGEQYVVGQWVQDAMKIIDETHSRNQIPIVVGGTSYWIQHLMFSDRLASDEVDLGSVTASESLAKSLSSLPSELLEIYNTLPEHASDALDPPAALQLHTLLSALDPTVAARWHWRDTRKVLRSLRIMKGTGRKPSEIIAEQSETLSSPRYRTLCFWLYADTPVLHQRLNSRVDDMIKQGLLDEISSLRRIACPSGLPETADNVTADYTLGIYQSIGYKEFHGYMSVPQPSKKLFDEAVDQMKSSTRRYAKRQVSWLRNKLLPAVYAANTEANNKPPTPTYLLDATELGDKWENNVLDLGERITQAFLSQDELPDPKSLSDVARQMLTIEAKPTNPAAVLNSRRKAICPVCTVDDAQPVMIEEGREWDLHETSRTHKKLVARAQRIASGVQWQPRREKTTVSDEDEDRMPSETDGLTDALDNLRLSPPIP
ncbi:tRNA isopentenyltransferase [Athelia psychrophila]|uniref:tRNA dimethylallyltransferase n=1 Tax=Athelia psychrophila TaxID=1759441 RepID=A0A166SXB8_9AGAM|nr:tRNA isopentenyltransferase [Fibularhizoctonia sp. CBS 109695]